MKKMNRVTAILLAFLMMFPLAACSNNAAEPNQESSKVSVAEIVPETESDNVSVASAPDGTANALQEKSDPMNEADYAAYEDETSNGEAGDPLPDSIPDLEERFVSEPYIPETLEKAMTGHVGPERYSPSKYPFSCIAYMEVEAECGCTWIASGFMVSRCGLMTAAHCLNCTEHNQPFKYIDFYFGYKSQKNYLYKYNGKFTWWSVEYDDDYGYILFPEPIGETTGWLGCRVLTDADANNEKFYTFGYRDGVMKVGRGDMNVCSDKLYYHYIDTEPDYSGCPICDMECYAVGINIAENKAGTYNIARRITSDLLEQMKKDGLWK